MEDKKLISIAICAEVEEFIDLIARLFCRLEPGNSSMNMAKVLKIIIYGIGSRSDREKIEPLLSKYILEEVDGENILNSILTRIEYAVELLRNFDSVESPSNMDRLVNASMAIEEVNRFMKRFKIRYDNN